MKGMIVDGRAIAEEIYTELKPKFVALGRAIKLGIIVVGANPVIESFVRIKTRAAERLGIEMVRINVSDKSDIGKVLQAVDRAVASTDAIIVQLPLPGGIDTNEVLAAIPPEKDVDALNPTIPADEHLVFAPGALAVVVILKRSNVATEGARV